FTPDGPPYDDLDPARLRPNAPVPRCEWRRESVVSGLTWAPDGSAFAFADADGVWTVPLPATFQSCTELSGGNMVAPGGSQPHWRPADGEVPKDPQQPPRGSGGSGESPVTLYTCVNYAADDAERMQCVCSRGLAPDVCGPGRIPPAVRKGFAKGCTLAA